MAKLELMLHPGERASLQSRLKFFNFLSIAPIGVLDFLC